MADYAVSTVFKGKDGITDKLKGMGAAANKFGRDSSSAFDKASRSGISFKKVVGGILTANMIGRGVGLLKEGMRTVISEFIDFDDAIVSAGAKFPETVVRGTRAFDELRGVARKVGATTKFTATDAAKGLDYLAMAGFNAKQAMAALPQITNLAVVANADLARATDIASDALGAFNMMTKDKAKLTANLTRINDVFAKTVVTANTDIEMLFESMKMGGPVATAAGASIETFSALVGTMANAGIKGSLAGTTLKNMFNKLQGPVPAAQKIFKNLRLELVNKEGKLRDVISILGDFSEKTKKMGDAQRNAAIKTIFGERAIAGVNVLLAAGADKLNAYRNTLEKAGGASQKMADIINKGLGNRLKGLKSAAIDLGFKFFDTFENRFPSAIDAATEKIRTFNMNKVMNVINEVMGVFKDLIKAAKPLTPVIWGLVAAKTAYVVTTKAMLALEAVQYFTKLASATKAATGAQSALNVAMTANPIGVVIMAVAGLVTAGVMLVKQWDNIKLLYKYYWLDIRRTLGFATRFIVTKWRGCFNDIKSIATGALNKVKEIWKPIEGFFTGLWDRITLAFESKFKAISGIAEKIAGLFPGIFGSKAAVKGTKPPVTKPAVIKPLAKITEQQLGALGMPMPTVTAKQSPVVQRQRIELARQEVARQKAQVEKQKILFEGRLQIAGAPSGSKMESKTIGAPPIRVEGLGVNP